MKPTVPNFRLFKNISTALKLKSAQQFSTYQKNKQSPTFLFLCNDTSHLDKNFLQTAKNSNIFTGGILIAKDLINLKELIHQNFIKEFAKELTVARLNKFSADFYETINPNEYFDNLSNEDQRKFFENLLKGNFKEQISPKEVADKVEKLMSQSYKKRYEGFIESVNLDADFYKNIRKIFGNESFKGYKKIPNIDIKYSLTDEQNLTKENEYYAEMALDILLNKSSLILASERELDKIINYTNLAIEYAQESNEENSQNNLAVAKKLNLVIFHNNSVQDSFHEFNKGSVFAKMIGLNYANPDFTKNLSKLIQDVSNNLNRSKNSNSR